jgi:transcriptional regulator with XRE-family HTH domain
VEAFYRRFGAVLRQRRLAARLTQEDLASRLGLNRTTVVNIEKGRQRIALHQLLVLADVLGCEPLALLPDTRLNDGDRVGSSVDDEVATFVSRVQAQRKGKQWEG